MQIIPHGFGVGLPDRWRARAYKALSKAAPKVGQEPSPDYLALCQLLDAVKNAPVKVDATDAQLCMLAKECADECTNAAMDFSGRSALMRRILGVLVIERGLTPPTGADEPACRRMMDAAWWRRQLRTLHGRTFEHVGLRLGLVSMTTGSYCSHETVERRRQQIARNEAAMRAVTMTNDRGQKFSMYEMAQRGMANKSNRKGELMLRMAGCEEIAQELGHVGLFITMTCPSKYHAVIARTGAFNVKYQGATPRQAQDYLNLTWSRIRAKNDRDGIAPYGFRIAEPHHDGCPHWHILVFLPRSQVQDFIANLGAYAMAEDAYELNSDAARDARLKIIEIDPAKGSAASYIAKYVGKNIDDSQGDAGDEEGAAMLDPNGDPIRQACQRVDAWASVWGIRQFQGLGMPPVTVWRELRRVANLADGAPWYVRQAVNAGKRITCKLSANFCKEPAVIKAADFADYIRAQGGINLGRGYRIGVKVEVLGVIGKYGVIDAGAPVGVFSRADPLEVVYPSTRYTWTREGGVAGLPVAVALDVAGPWSPLNKCTGPVCPVWWADDSDPFLPESVGFDWLEDLKLQNFIEPPDAVAMQWLEMEAEAAHVRANTVWTVPNRLKKSGVNHV